MGKSIHDEYKNICLQLVGEWFNEANGEKYIFDFIANILKDFPMTVITKKGVLSKTFYSIGFYNYGKPKMESEFYISIGRFGDKKFWIKNIQKDKIILNRLNGSVPMQGELIWVRKKDQGFADEILKAID